MRTHTEVQRRTTFFMRLLGLVALCVGLSAPAAADIMACGTTPSYNDVGDFLPASTTLGCSTTDYNFYNFVLDNSAAGTMVGTAGTLPADNVSPVPLASTIFINPSASDPGVIVISSPGPDTGGGAKADQNFCSPTSTNSGWCISGKNQTMVSSLSYTMESLSGSSIQYVGFSGIIYSHSSGGGVGSSALVFREICTAMVTDWGNNGSGCTDAGGTYKVLQGGQIVGGFNSLPFALVADLGGTFNTVYIRDTVFLDTNNGDGSWAALLPITLIDSPEPSTFGLMSMALGGLALFGMRRRRKA